jgi:hypothetical protein
VYRVSLRGGEDGRELLDLPQQLLLAAREKLLKLPLSLVVDLGVAELWPGAPDLERLQVRVCPVLCVFGVV